MPSPAHRTLESTTEQIWQGLGADESHLAFDVTYFNWIWVHSRLGTTAAQRADLTAEPWTWLDIAVYPTLC